MTTLRPLLPPLAALLLLACWLSFSPWPNEAVEAVWAGIDRVCGFFNIEGKL